MSRKYLPAAVAIDGDVIYSKKHVWFYVELSPTPYEFLDYNSREALAESATIGYESLIQNNKPVDCKLIVTSTPFDDYSWSKELNERTKKNNPSPYWNTFFRDMANYVHSHGFRQRKVYLGIKLGNRSEFRNSSAFGFLRDVSDVLTRTMGIEDSYIDEKELKFFRDRADNYWRTLGSSTLKAKRVDANTLAGLIKEPLWPEMEMPEASTSTREQWGAGEIQSIGVAAIDNSKKKFIAIEQTDLYGRDQVGYRATLCFARFPDMLDFPGQEPWMHFSSSLSGNPTIYSNFTVVPSTKVAKDVERLTQHAEDQANNSRGHLPIAVQEQLATAQELKFSLNRDRKPWIYGRHSIAITGRTEEELRDRVQEAIDHYKNLDIDLSWPTGDQINLMLEAQPGEGTRVQAYQQRQELGIIPIGMPTGSGKVGDSISVSREGSPQGWIGPYLGYTTSRVLEPVFFDIHSAIARNRPPGVVITGAPGSGKTFTAMTLTYHMALRGVWTIFIDPKGDAKEFINLKGLQDRARLFDLKYGNDGLLDPFTLTSEPAQQQLLAIETIQLFLGRQLNSEEQGALNDAIRTVSRGTTPTLYEVVEVLLTHETVAGRTLGSTLDVIRGLNFARLCFSPVRDTTNQISASDGLTIISLESLDLPATSDRETYTTTNFLAVGIMYLLAHYTESLMYSTNKNHPKAVIIDEAWAITSTPQGANMIPRLARMGRSLNTAVILVSQNAGDFLKITNNMSYRLAFGTKDKDEINNVSAFFDLEKDEEGNAIKGNAQTIAGLTTGECLMKDPDGNISRIVVDGWNEMMSKTFNTNPDTRTTGGGI